MVKNVEELTQIVANAAGDKKAHDLLILDIRGLSVIADYFVLCNGQSNTQVQAIAEAVRQKMAQSGVPVKGVEGYDEAKWILLDFGDIIVHVFRQEEREFYNLERLWGDAPQVNLG